jgi:hypothetical protein
MTRNWEEIDRFLAARGVRIGAPTLGQTTGGKHNSSARHFSNHFVGTARDYGQHDSNACAVARKLELIALQPNGPIAELYCSVGPQEGIFIRNGQRLSPVPLTLWTSHRDHCHVALKPGRRLF